MDNKQAANMISENLTSFYGYAFARLYDKNDVDDLTSEIVYEILRSSSRLSDESAFWAFAWKIAENTFRKFIRRKERSGKAEPLPEDIELPDLGIEDEFYEDEEEEPFEEDMEEFCSHLEEYRTQAVAILQNREKSIDDRIREYLKFCEKLQNVVENPEEELWEPMEYFHVRMETFDELENVNEEWMEVKQRVRDFFETHSYTEALEEYKKSGDYNEIWYEHILVYFTYRYFMRAWYDGNVLAKAQFAIVGFLVIRDMDIVRYFANGKSFKLDDRIANARIFSREVEHSEETLEILEDDISFDEAFHVKHLLGQI